MVKRGSSTFSAASVAKGSVILSRAIEKNFALEAEVSRLRHHVSVLSRRLHSVTMERDGLRDMVIPTMEIEEWGREPPVSEEVAEEKEEATSVAGKEAGDATSVAEREMREATSVADEDIRDATSVAEEEVREATSVADIGEREATSVADEDVPVVARGFQRFTMDLMDDDEWERRLRRRGWELAAANASEPGMADREATSVADEDVPEVARGCNRFAMDLVEEEVSVPVPPVLTDTAEAVARRSGELESEGDWPTLGTPNRSTGEAKMTHSSDEDVVLGGVIVAGGASKRAKRNRGRKRKSPVPTGWG